jgi:NAD(P)-dependent dehydrogenase (short-subunit alcohol dehydrogenase family)
MQDIRQPDVVVRGPLAVTGAAQGIGYEVARLALSAGTPVAMIDRDGDRLGAAIRRLDAEGSVVPFAVDVSQEDAVASCFERIAEQLGPVAGLVTSAGIERVGPLHELSAATFDEVIATNLRGTFLATRAAVAQMLKAETGGAIVCISSTFGRTAGPDVAAYSASKAGVCALARSLAVDYGSRGIRANALLPGPTETGLMWSNVPPEEREEIRRTISREIPLGRLAKAAEPAAAAIWLISEQASFITGAEIACDGGVLAKSAVSV